MGKVNELYEAALRDLDAKTREAFDKHLEYRSPENQRVLRYDKVHDYDGGTEIFFDQVYHSLYKDEKARESWKGKGAKGAASKLEHLILKSLDISPIGKRAKELFEARKADGEFESPDKIIGELSRLAGEYLGVDVREDRAWLALVSEANSGDPLMFKQRMKEFLDSLKGSYINHIIGQHMIKHIPPDKYHEFAVYKVSKMKDYGYEPEKIGAELAARPEHHLHGLDAIVSGQENKDQMAERMGYKKKKVA
ncbi:hypothetical protein A3K72_01705 [Candidatus Woesearchaeota archaeon RBG_13_36_6]|nr:MAG: hypothetical protein A3K72_01705 [Candidatus Woesearchaeota archaeon RBG_13_36_6]